jgi:cytochrome c-type biogenesis protein CcmH
MRRPRTLVTVAVALLALASPAVAAEPRAGIADLEDEVMCPICGTLLELSESPQAERQRAFVAALIAAGKTKAEIKEELVAEYGREVLALPEGSGFQLSAYLVPAVALLVAALALTIGIGRWRRDSRRAESSADASPGPRAEDAERLEADLARYDL